MSEINFFLSFGMEGGICRVCGKFMLPKPIDLDKTVWKCPLCHTRIKQVKSDDGSCAYLEMHKGFMEKMAGAINPLGKFYNPLKLAFNI